MDRLQLTRRTVLAGLVSAAAATPASSPAAQPAADQRTAIAPSNNKERVVVVGAGVFGAWTAWHLLKRGKRVSLVDAWGPAHVRASSGGESRMTRTAYGRDAVYTRFAWESLEDWRWLSLQAGLPTFHAVGVLFFFPRLEPYVSQTLDVHRQLGIPIDTLDRATLIRRYPQVSWEGVELALHEPDRGALMARRAVQTLVREFVAAGGEYRQAAVQPPPVSSSLTTLVTASGERLQADQFVFACGAWLPKLFPDVLGGRIFPTRQEVFFFSAPPGDPRFGPAQLPGWADFNDGDIYYGFPIWKRAVSKLLTIVTAPQSIPTETTARPRPQR